MACRGKTPRFADFGGQARCRTTSAVVTYYSRGAAEDMASILRLTKKSTMRSLEGTGLYAGRVRALRTLFRALGVGRPLRPAATIGRRAVILHLDGVSTRTLEHASRAGRVPFLTRLLDSGSAVSQKFLAGAPASTSAFQAGLLYGAVDDVPGYLWWDKRRNRAMRSDSAATVSEVEERHARHDPGLLAGGTSYATLYAGGATPPMLNLGRAYTLQWNSNFRHWPLRAAAPIQTALGLKMLARLAWDTPRWIASALSWSAKVGRTDWEGRLLAMRMLTAIPLREMATWGTIGDISIGVPLVYTCFVDYDEVAHRRGPRSEEALAHLEATDACIAKIHAAAAALPDLRYDVYVIADHGMTESTPFASVTGGDFADFLREAAGAERDRNMKVIDAGDIAHVYFIDEREPLHLERIEAHHGRFLRALRASAGVPMLLARSRRGPAALTRDRVYWLDEPASCAALAAHPLFEGREAETLVAYLRRVVAMPSAGDLVLYGNEAGRTIAFSWEFGSHGGIAADELDCFAIHPPEVELDFSSIRLPEQLHTWFVRYRPPLPARQDLALGMRSPDPAIQHAAFRAIADEAAFPDASADAAASSCEAVHEHAHEREPAPL